MYLAQVYRIVGIDLRERAELEFRSKLRVLYLPPLAGLFD